MNIYMTVDEKTKLAVIKRLIVNKMPHQSISFSGIIRYCVNYTYANIKGRK